MRNQNRSIPLLICAALFAGALALFLMLSGQKSSSGHVVISEILSSNRTYPAPNGKLLDYIEIHNPGDIPVDISGYMLSDAPDAIGYTFPSGTVIPADGYCLCWCDKEADSRNYARFGISKDGTDTLYLYNSANVQIDVVSVIQSNTNVPLIRGDDGTWIPGETATPGFPNTPQGYEAYLTSIKAQTLDVTISEVMTGSSCTAPDDSGVVCDWIELHNFGNVPAVLDGCFLSDDPTEPTKWKIPALTLQPGEYKVIRCMGDFYGPDDANFSLPRDGCTVVLSGSLGNVLSKTVIPTLNKDHSWALQSDGTYLQTLEISPGAENSEAGHQIWLGSIGAEAIPLVISEVMTNNRGTIVNEPGQLADWVELYNAGSQSIDLSGMYLSNNIADRAKYRFENLILEPGQRTVIFCDGTNAAPSCATFALSSEGCDVVLTGHHGNVISHVEIPALDDDCSWSLQTDGSYRQTHLVSPGFENSEAGYAQYNKSQAIAGPLMISEVMPANNIHYRQSDGKYYDWVELQNISNQSIQLSEYCISNDKSALDRFRLPNQILEPGKRVIIICSGNTELGGFIQAPFTLSRSADWLYLSRNGQLVDYMRIFDVPYQGSIGRTDTGNGTYYFTTPTPGTANGTGVGLISATPLITTPDGVYDNVPSVTVEMSGAGTLRYTTDGSAPTQSSAIYTGPLTLSSSTVVRVACFEDGKVPSDVVTASYIINENHTLPVISLALNPTSFGQIWTDGWDGEVPCNAALFENGEGFHIDCGIEMYGHMGLTNPKKSMKINFRGAYGQSTLNYPVYGEDAPVVYESLVIRSGQDYPLSIFRDELFTGLAAEASDALLTQRQKYCILYINGQYYGIYCLKEAFSETYYAENKHVDKSSVSILQAPVIPGTDIFQLLAYVGDHDMADPVHYQYIADRVNLDSMIDWMIFEAYSTNSDIQQNLRYFRSTQTGNKWEFAYYDLDWAWHFHNNFFGVLSPEAELQHATMTRGMMKNPEFREKFLTRCGELYKTTLSDEHVLETIDAYYALLAPEVPRERERWGGNFHMWADRVQKMRDFLNSGHWNNLISDLYRYVGLTAAEEAKYFGG